jgi:hypothetical protein
VTHFLADSRRTCVGSIPRTRLQSTERVHKAHSIIVHSIISVHASYTYSFGIYKVKELGTSPLKIVSFEEPFEGTWTEEGFLYPWRGSTGDPRMRDGVVIPVLTACQGNLAEAMVSTTMRDTRVPSGRDKASLRPTVYPLPKVLLCRAPRGHCSYRQHYPGME